MPSAISIIKRDHRAVEKSYALYKKAKTDARKLKIAKEIFDSLDEHAVMEEKKFYPRVRKESDKKHKDLVSHAAVEHRKVKTLIGRLRKTKEVEDLDAGMEELMDMVTAHVSEEEMKLLPYVDGLFGRKRLAEMGEELEKLSPTA
jgi:hemerythrin superfamily protein